MGSGYTDNKQAVLEQMAKNLVNRLLEFDPNRGAPGRSVPKYGHYPNKAERAKIASDFGGELPFPKRFSKPINIQQYLNHLYRKTYDPRAKASAEALGVFRAAKEGGPRFQPSGGERIPGQFQNAKDAGTPFFLRTTRTHRHRPGNSPVEDYRNKQIRSDQGEGTPADIMQRNINTQRVGFRAKRLGVESAIMDEAKSPAWQRSEGKNPEGGLNKKGVMSYRKANPGSKLQTAVTTKPSKLKKGSKKAKRRLSFCRRMKGMKNKLTSAKTARDPNSRINKSLRKWNC